MYGPLAGEDRHRARVGPLGVLSQRLAQDALGAEAGLLVCSPCARIEGIDLQRDPVQADVLEAVTDDQAGGLGAQPAALAGWTEQDAEVATLVALIPLVQHDLSHAPAAGAVDNREVEPVGLLVA